VRAQTAIALLLPALLLGPALGAETPEASPPSKGGSLTEDGSPTDDAPDPSADGPAPDADEKTTRTVMRAPRPPRTAGEVVLEVHPGRVPLAGETAADLLAHAPSVRLLRAGAEGGAPRILIRGFDAGHGRDLAVEAGGIPVNVLSHIHGQGHADLQLVIPEIVRHLRVIEGPFQPHQGDLALAGSAHYTLGLREAGPFARTSAGAFGGLRVVGAHRPAVPWAEPSTFVAGEVTRSDGFGPERAFLRGSVLGQLGLHLSGPWEMRVLAGSHGGRFASAGMVREADVLGGQVDRFDTHRPGQGGESARHQALVEIAHLDRETRFEASAFGVVVQDARRHDATGFLEFPEGDLVLMRHAGRFAGARATVEHEARLLDRPLVLGAGVDGRLDRAALFQGRLDGEGAVHTVEVDRVVHAGRLSGFGELRFDVARWLVLRAGGRVDALSLSSRLTGGAGPTALTRPAAPVRGVRAGPRLTAEWRPGPRRSVFLSYGSGFRSVHALEVVPGESPFTEAHSVELGSRLRGPRLHLATALFATRIGNERVVDPVTGATLFAGPTLRTGNVIQLRLGLGAGLRLHGGLGLVHAIATETGEVLPHVPPAVGHLGVDGERPLPLRVAGRNLHVVTGARLHGLAARPLQGGEEGEPVLLVDGWAGVRAGAFALSVEATNLTGVRWWEDASVHLSRFDPGAPADENPVRHLAAGRPRTVQGTLTFRY
jgi:iron complex outermembrane recepter protein